MGFSFKMSGINTAVLQLRKKLCNTSEERLLNRSTAIIHELAESTPVDTGLASKSWYSISRDGKVFIRNDVPYISRLNSGSSAQAPAYFVEKIALQYGKPVGSIVRNTE